MKKDYFQEFLNAQSNFRVEKDRNDWLEKDNQRLNETICLLLQRCNELQEIVDKKQSG